MSQLIFRCPYTNRAIQPGIELLDDSIETVSTYPISLDCPHCGNRHHGTVADGFLTDDRTLPVTTAPDR